MSNAHLSQELAHFASTLQAKDIPADVMSRAEDLLVSLNQSIEHKIG